MTLQFDSPDAIFGVDVHEGRLLYDTQREQYVTVDDFDTDARTVTVVYLEQSPDGVSTPYGTLARTTASKVIDWPAEGGRYVPS